MAHRQSFIQITRVLWAYQMVAAFRALAVERCQKGGHPCSTATCPHPQKVHGRPLTQEPIVHSEMQPNGGAGGDWGGGIAVPHAAGGVHSPNSADRLRVQSLPDSQVWRVDCATRPRGIGGRGQRWDKGRRLRTGVSLCAMPQRLGEQRKHCTSKYLPSPWRPQQNTITCVKPAPSTGKRNPPSRFTSASSACHTGGGSGTAEM